MKRLLFALLLVAMLISCAAADGDATITIEYLTPSPAPVLAPVAIRNGLTFGATLDDITAAEGRAPDGVRDGMAMYLNATALSGPADIVYELDEKGLLRSCAIFLRATHYNPDAYIDDYDKADAALSSKYGSPSSPKYVYWENSAYSYLESALGSCVSLGYASLYTLWKQDNVEISHSLMCYDLEYMHTIRYDDPSFVKVETTPDPNSLGI